MKLALIACCGTKAAGGSPDYQPPLSLEHRLGHDSFQRLLEARRDLAQMLCLEPGPDLGFDQSASGLAFLPAYRRYTGIVYQSSGLNQRLPGACCKVVIISALYGILEAGDPIRNYDLAMKCKLPDGTKVHTKWKQHRLGDLLYEYAKNTAPAFTHDLLSEDYRIAVQPWPKGLSSERFGLYTYPNRGIGSLYDRGRDLKVILEK